MALLVVGTGSSHVFAAFHHGGPVAVPDVPAYLSVSQWIHGGILTDNLQFFPGYGLLLSAFGGMNSSSLQTAALCLNGVVAAGVVLLAAILARRLNGSRTEAAVLGFLAAVHPALTSASKIAWPETIIAFVVLVLAIMMTYNSRYSWLWIGFLSAIAFTIHPRLIVIFGSLFCLAILIKKLKMFVAGALLGAVPMAVAIASTNTWPTSRLEAAQSISFGPGPIATGLGQLLAQNGATAGLAGVALAVGILSLTKLVRGRGVSPAPAFISLSFLGMLILGGWVLAGSARADTLLYGRYTDPWVIPLVVIGFLHISQQRKRFIPIVFTFAVSVAAIIGCLYSSGYVSGPGRRIMTASLGLLWHVSDQKILPTAVVAFLITVFGLLFMLSRSWWRILGPVTLLIAIAIPSSFLNHSHFSKVGAVSAGQSAATASLPSDVRCLSHELSSTKSYVIWLYRLKLPNIEHEYISLRDGDAPCDRYVVAGLDLAPHCQDAYLVATDPRGFWGVWEYPVPICN